MSWTSTQFPGIKSYDFAYDGLNRLKSATFVNAGLYNTSYTYDANGNIETLNRCMNLSGVAESIDQLDYDYTGNQLKKVDDALGMHFENNGFKDNGSYQTVEYDYDKNGNMTEDKNKGIDLIAYNHLNLPTNIVFNNGQPEEKSIGYIYTADGTKLRKYTNGSGTENTATDYIGAYVYENNELQFIQTSEGRLVPDGSGGFNYEYAIKDLPIAIGIGNTRVMFSQTGEVLQDQSYYPFGMSMGEALTFDMPSSLPDNKYLYNGKELQDDFELGWYDYGARFYDAALGRWTTPDPLCEVNRRWSPYRYAYDNPLRYIDPDGMLEDWWIDEERGSLTHTAGDNKPEGTENNDNVQHLGEDGMFGDEGADIEYVDNKSGGETTLTSEDSKEIAEAADYKVVPVEETTTSDTKSKNLPNGDLSSTKITGTVEIKENKVTYTPVGTEEISRTFMSSDDFNMKYNALRDETITKEKYTERINYGNKTKGQKIVERLSKLSNKLRSIDDKDVVTRRIKHPLRK